MEERVQTEGAGRTPGWELVDNGDFSLTFLFFHSENVFIYILLLKINLIGPRQKERRKRE